MTHTPCPSEDMANLVCQTIINENLCLEAKIIPGSSEELPVICVIKTTLDLVDDLKKKVKEIVGIEPKCALISAF